MNKSTFYLLVLACIFFPPFVYYHTKTLKSSLWIILLIPGVLLLASFAMTDLNIPLQDKYLIIGVVELVLIGFSTWYPLKILLAYRKQEQLR